MKVRISGIVQGVGFRPFIYRTAVKNHLKGYVRNRGDAVVEMLLEGEEEDVKNFMWEMETKKPLLAQIYGVEKKILKGERKYKEFRIFRSSEKAEISGSIIPPDIAICDECLRELQNPEDPRFRYFFVTCVNCGPRYTIIERLPYDRENTSMRDFPMCSFCKKEFTDVSNRRFHAQTVACPACGPEAYLTTKSGEKLDLKDPIAEAGKLLSEGFIVAIKGIGGFHIASSTVLDEPLLRLRKAKYRRQKPFAIMAPNIDVVKTFAEVSPRESKELISHARPIVLLKKSDEYYLSDLVAPGLHNVGVMLPYTGLHFMLFSDVADPAFVMTSANPPNQPIIIDNLEALNRLGNTVDYFLLHNRRIVQRCDDSVVRLHGKMRVFIRRSRGYAPEPIFLREKSERCVLGLGGELNNTVCILMGNKAFLSPHVGDVENVETRDSLDRTIRHLIHLTNSRIEAVACDMHPKFVTTKIASELAEENMWEQVQVQHHHAHIAGLMAEYGVDEIVGICCDGYGYGLDGESWGGEILLCRYGSHNFKRLAHLQKQPLIGGDLATRYPLRVAAGILYGQVDIEDWLLKNKKYFPYGEKEVQTLLHQLARRERNPKTTSCGRVLDAVSAILGVCQERTYEGEPAMKLESLAIEGRIPFKVEPKIERETLNTTLLVKEIFENRERFPKADLAFLAHKYLAEGLAALAVEKAREEGVKTVGFSGGVAYNKIIISIVRRIVEASGLNFLVHESIPPGDGGLSLGQAIVAGFKYT